VTCDEIRNLLSPFADGELDLVRSVAIEEHLNDCADCATALERMHNLSAALHDPALYFQPPVNLSDRIHADLRRAEEPRRRRLWRSPLAATAAAILLFVAGWAALKAISASGADDLIARDVVASHVRSLMLDAHRLDVASSDRHQVKPWFIGKLDFAPEVRDLSQEGFPLAGGRLDYLGDHGVAALVYEHAKHAINVFIWRTTQPDRAPQTLERQGYHLIHWINKGQAVWIVSDVNAQELEKFARLLREPE
jgi:anti-sigma factor RsiW